MDLETKYNLMKTGGQILSEILFNLKENIKPGISGDKLDKLAEELIYSLRAQPAFKNYQAPFAQKPYPYTLCLSLNEVVVHGYPQKNLIIRENDVIKVDLGIYYQGVYLDSAFTIYLGDDEKIKKLVETTKKALIETIKIIKPGITTGDIGWKIESTIEDNGFSVIKELCGHDIGEYLHGDLQILNWGDPGKGTIIKNGMFFTIEPMASLGLGEIEQVDDYIFKTKDNSPSTHFEVTLGVVNNKVEVFTKIL